nr:hypothetical protein [Tanacetum cinerariifolium]
MKARMGDLAQSLGMPPGSIKNFFRRCGTVDCPIWRGKEIKRKVKGRMVMKARMGDLAQSLGMPSALELMILKTSKIYSKGLRLLVEELVLLEVILNGDSSVPTRVIEGVVQPVAPTTAEQKLAMKNELKARGTLLMALWKRIRLKRDKSEQKQTKSDKNGKRVEAGKSLKQLQWVEQEKLSKTQKEWPKMQIPVKSYSTYKKRKEDKGLNCKYSKVQRQGPKMQAA